MKSDKLTVRKRLVEIYQMMCQGANSIDIVEYARENWGISYQRAYKMINVAMEWIDKKIQKDQHILRAEANIRFDKLYTKLYKDGKYRDAGYIQTQKNKVNGLEITNVDLTSKGEKITNITVTDLRKSYEEINADKKQGTV